MNEQRFTEEAAHFAFTAAFLRERHVRQGGEPRNDREREWSLDGDRPFAEYDVVRNWKAEERP